MGAEGVVAAAEVVQAEVAVDRAGAAFVAEEAHAAADRAVALAEGVRAADLVGALAEDRVAVHAEVFLAVRGAVPAVVSPVAHAVAPVVVHAVALVEDHGVVSPAEVPAVAPRAVFPAVVLHAADRQAAVLLRGVDPVAVLLAAADPVADAPELIHAEPESVGVVVVVPPHAAR